ncbi:MAG: hypothetical protein ACK5U0_18170 [Gemmatimonas sp.]|uniref:hypothetical protein n=1 Tax=Gemmatimonas sp. TaxID=1962908 RepID=UPI0039194216
MSSSSRPLLSLVNASAEWQAGLPPRCRASVRLLDRVHVSVRQGDCIVVHHRDPSSATVLLAALRGHGALAAGAHLTGERHVGAGVRIRRCRISLDTMQAVQEGWRSAPREAAASPGRPVVYLLRATRRQPEVDGTRQQWREWAQRARAAGDALVLVTWHVPHGDDPAVERPRGALHEPTPHGYRLPGEGSRVMRLHHGRLFDLTRWE